MEVRYKAAGVDTEASSFLNNDYDDYQKNPGSKMEIIARYVALAVSVSKELGKLEPGRIIPLVRDRAWLEEMHAAKTKAGATETEELACEELSEELVVVYAEDLPTHLSFLSAKSLTAAGLELASLRQAACKNLLQSLPRIEFHESGSDFYAVDTGGYAEPSLILIDSVWEGRRLKVKGEHVFAIPTRDTLLVTGSGTPEGIARMRAKAEEIYRSGPYRISTKLFVRRDGKIVDFTVPEVQP